MRLPVNHALSLALIAALAGGAAAYAKNRQPVFPVTGPAADYPVVVGAPFQVGNVTYTPEDKLNYDAVGYVDVGGEGGDGISAAHKTLPLPSYAEVTSLESGRTVLVRVERRGPMANDNLIELSPGAAAQLGLAGSARPAVRVRRVNPPEQERAMLRNGGRAPERMETPRGLLEVLNRKLNVAGPAPKLALRPPTAPAPQPVRAPQPILASEPVATLETSPMRATAPAPTPRPVANGTLVVQVAALSNQVRARTVAGQLGGRIMPAGSVWRIRLGPFATRGQAEAALAKARGAGYSDARIQRAD